MPVILEKRVGVSSPVTGPDYGCNSSGPQGQPPFKTSIGLHTNYTGSQLEFALSELASNKSVRLVTLGIGSNDVLIILAQCGNDPNGVNNLFPGVLQTYAHNLTRILEGIRSEHRARSCSSNTTRPLPLSISLRSLSITLRSRSVRNSVSASPMGTPPSSSPPCFSRAIPSKPASSSLGVRPPATFTLSGRTGSARRGSRSCSHRHPVT